ncbi:Pimeloyl-ACP methyl ester carboxylesterase [Gordonia malaquae]|uniref:Putative epoxide hydrolase n=1 Tax=Gordonia malaquae NBRC 108250 TaxID=1223542 RepID=M3VBU9_GORML|nr:alpha/beta fold hydrolase [Gordonia malaquae]GAC80893.1 putative epoxide hydrolase [Gordonia malaquae NBRC 108250]SED69485.1 Pimeloyl-ACP methyl ester carboxylesterase [Gordonia malaquae]
MEQFTRDGLTFDVIDSGPTDGDVVLLLHGFPQTGSSWSGVSAVLNEHGFRTIAPTQRGYSPGARPRGRRAYRTSELTADAVALVEQLDRGPVHLVGHDWGAAVAWSLAASRPDLVRSFTSVSVPHPGAFISSMTRSRQLLRSWYMFAFQVPRLPEYLIRRFPDRFEAKLSSGGLTPEEAAEIRRDVLETDALTGGMNWYRAMMLGAPRDLKRRVAVPTTHVWSDADFALDRAGAELAADYVTADFRLEVFEGVSHWIPDQRPTELADVILARIASASG